MPGGAAHLGLKLLNLESRKMFSLVALYLRVLSGRLDFDEKGRPRF
jgi:hypothetical protein